MRKILVVLPLFLTLAACGTEDNTSATKGVSGPPYLALGDSITFGTNPLIPLNPENVAQGLFVGYPEVLAQRLGYAVTNTGCAGETTSSFIDRGIKDNGCHTGEDPRDQYLKVEYTVNQLDFAKDFLRENLDTKLVTLSLGGNDILLVENECDATAAPALCKFSKVPSVIVTFGKNLVKVVKDIRSTGYAGPIVFVSNYARDYKDAVQKIALGLLDTEAKAIAAFNGFKVASGYKAFEAASKDFNSDVCEAGLAIALPDGGCNQHPSQKGRELLAQTVLDVLAK